MLQKLKIQSYIGSTATSVLCNCVHLRFDWSAQSKVQVYLCTCVHCTPSLCFDWSAQSKAGRKESNGWDESNAWVDGQSGKTDVMMTGVGWQSGHHKENEPRSAPNVSRCVPKMSKHNVMNVAIAETERVPFLVLDFSWSLRRVCQQPSVGRCVSRVPIPTFIFLLFIVNYLISHLPILILILNFLTCFPWDALMM